MANVWDTSGTDFGIDYKIDTSNINTDFNTPVPSFDWTRAADLSFYDAPALDRTYSFPTAFQNREPQQRQEQKQPTWMKALESALGYKTYGSSNTAPSRQQRSKRAGVGGGEIAAQGRGYTVYQPGPTQKTETRSRQSSGLGEAIGTLAGVGLSFVPGVGPTAAAAAPKVLGKIGSFFG